MTATPQGDRIPLSDIQQQHVSITYRPIRPVYKEDLKNVGSPFKGTIAKRGSYQDHLNWPLINRFPKPNVIYQPTIVEILNFYPRYCVLPDYYKFWILVSRMAGKHSMWRMDFNKRGQIPLNFTPHGMAAVVRDKEKRLRFPIWDGYQFHGDVGERLHLKHRYTQAQFDAKCADPGAEARHPVNNEFRSWYLGDLCPPQYRCPPD